MNFFDVSVPSPLHQTFTYKAEGSIAKGVRVKVPFGPRKVVGVVLGQHLSPPQPSEFVIKDIHEVIDQTPIYSSVMLELATWMSSYYIHPLGEVLRAMLPASQKRTHKRQVHLTDFGMEARDNPTHPHHEHVKKIFGTNKNIVSQALAKSRITVFPELSLAKLTKLGLITLKNIHDASARVTSQESPRSTTEAYSSSSSVPVLTPAQAQIKDRITESFHSPTSKVFLLHGVTGAGKTEVYLQSITELLSSVETSQALVLVPEISLTPQMTQAFASRFPGLVAVVHSGLSDQERWAELSRIRNGDAKILIGPRSAVFGPFQNLKLLIVDEEHDMSYKQSSGLMYHGRDIAVLRGKLEKATVILGSATPSLESMHNAMRGRYELLELKQRVTGRPLPQIGLITPSHPKRATELLARTIKGHDHGSDQVFIDPEVQSALRQNFAAGHQSIVLVNRRGYAYYLLSLEDQKPVQCPNCSISMTLHKRSTMLRCHYCDYQASVEHVIAGRSLDSFITVGYGSQKAEEALAKIVPEANIARLDSDIITQRDILPATLAKFRGGEIDILVGTQILAKGHDFPNVTLIVILEVDQLLGLPDFRAGERTFQLIVQAAGRAGRANLPGHVLIQAVRATHPVVMAAVDQDFDTFLKRELEFRRQHAYPPFTRAIAIEFTSPDIPLLSDLTHRIEQWFESLIQLKPALMASIRVLGPSVPAIETIRGRHRRMLLLSSHEVEHLRQVTKQFLNSFQKLPSKVRMTVDVDPQSLI